MGEEWLTMNTCQLGKWLPSEVQIPGVEPISNSESINSIEKLCRYLHHKNPYLKLGPFKEELSSVKPYAVVFHDILSEAEIGIYIEFS